MGPATQLDPVPTPHVRQPREQGLPTTLLVLLVVSMLGMGMSIAAFFVPGAVVSFLCVVVFYALIVVVKIRDRRAWAHARIAHDHLDDQSQQLVDENADIEEIAPDVAREVVAAERAGFKMGVIIVAPLAALALLLAAVFVGWKVIGLGALAFFGLMLLMGAPVWVAAMEEQIDDEEERIGVETHRIH